MKLKGSFDWMSNPQYLAQVGHFFGAYFVISIPATIVMLLEAPTWYTYAWFGIGVAAASYKEFVFDTSLFGVGEGDSWSDSLMDWAFYMLGGGIGLGLSKVFYYMLARLLVRHGIVLPD
jgi:hypothetical protein